MVGESRYIVFIGVPELQQNLRFFDLAGRRTEMEEPSKPSSNKTRYVGPDNTTNVRKARFCWATTSEELGDLINNLACGVPFETEITVKPAHLDNVPESLREYFSEWEQWISAREYFKRQSSLAR